MELKIKLLKKDDGRTPAIPKYQTEHSAAMDLCAFLDAPIFLAPMERALVPTGICAEIPVNYGGFVMARSGLASKQGLALSNGVGLIDADYRGEIKVAVTNFSLDALAIEDGQRIAQMVIAPISTCQITLCSELSD
ncbi:MAG: dUTP diphosphatase, partial [Oscillospiraceae bacterium]